MRKLIACTFFCFIISQPLPAGEYLVTVHGLGSRRAEFPVIEQIDTLSIMVADSALLRKLAHEGFRYGIVDVNPRDKFYLFIWGESESRQSAAQFGTILGCYGRRFLLRTEEKHISALNNQRVKLSRLLFKPLVPGNNRPGWREQVRIARDPSIENMVATVSEDSIRFFIKTLQSFYTRYSTSEENKTQVCPWVYERFKSYNCDSVYFHTFSESYGPNIIGIRRGTTDSSYTRYCILGGHVDVQPGAGRAAGADDNATGVAVMLEVARVLKDSAFHNTIQFHAWNAEEQGMVGSSVFAQYARSNNHEIIGGALNFDMIGCTVHGPNVEITYNADIAGCEDFALKFFADVTGAYTGLNYVMRHTTGIATDHNSFWREGYIAAGGVENFYHLNASYHQWWDTLDCPAGLNNTRHVAEVAKAALASIAVLAIPAHNTAVTQKQAAVSGKYPCIMFNKAAGACVISQAAAGGKGAAYVRIFDAQGCLIRSIQCPSHASQIIWDLCNQERKRVSPGIYLIALCTGRTMIPAKVMVH